MEIHDAARKHGITDADIGHAIRNAMTTREYDDGRRLYLGPARNASMLEVVTSRRTGRAEIVIHAMPMAAKYRRFLRGG